MPTRYINILIIFCSCCASIRCFFIALKTCPPSYTWTMIRRCSSWRPRIVTRFYFWGPTSISKFLPSNVRFKDARQINPVTMDQYRNSLRILTFFAHLLYDNLSVDEVMVFMLSSIYMSRPSSKWLARSNRTTTHSLCWRFRLKSFHLDPNWSLMLPSCHVYYYNIIIMIEWLMHQKFTEALRQQVKQMKDHNDKTMIALQSQFL